MAENSPEQGNKVTKAKKSKSTSLPLRLSTAAWLTVAGVTGGLALVLTNITTIKEKAVEVIGWMQTTPVQLGLRDSRVVSAYLTSGLQGNFRPPNSFQVLVETVVEKAGDVAIENCSPELRVGEEVFAAYEKHEDFSRIGEKFYFDLPEGELQRIAQFLALCSDERNSEKVSLRVVCSIRVTDWFLVRDRLRDI